MATPNPTATTYSSPPPKVSKQTYTIAGIRTTVYGLEDLPKGIKNVACIWLLHPRLQTQECMAPIAATTITEWNKRLQNTKDKARSTGLIAVSFDQRNHGTREVDNLANQAWRSGNESHAQDMFSIYHGTAVDTSHLIDYISAYAFPVSEHTITSHMALGISLGGHAVWHCLLQEPRITSGVVIIGCPDYVRVMSERARLSKLKTWTDSSPPGSQFLGSKDFPRGLVEVVEKYDPAGLLLGKLTTRTEDTYTREPTEEEKKRLMPLMKTTLQGKRILNLAGGADKLVPYKAGEPFLRWLKRAISKDGWFSDGGIILEDIVFDGVGHEMSPGMVKEVIRFIGDTFNVTEAAVNGRPSKI